MKRNLMFFAFIIVFSLAFGESVYAAWDGEGTEENPYLIRTVEDLNAIGSDDNHYFRLENDLDFADYTNTWSIHPFHGYLDGNGKTINSFQVSQSELSFTGLFSENTGTIRDLVMENAHVISKFINTGGLVGMNSGTIINVTITATIEGDSNVGGLVGENSGTIRDSHVNGNVSGSNSIGGLVGHMTDGKVTNSHAAGTVSGTENLGGLVGVSESVAEISESYSTGDVDGDLYVGSLIGVNKGIVQSSHATGDVTGVYDVGGLIGVNQGIVQRSHATGDVYNGEQERFGGLIGKNGSSGQVLESYAIGDVDGQYYVGGLIGENEGTVSHAYAIGDAHATGESINSDREFAGGLIGENKGVVNQAFSVGEVTGRDEKPHLIGGLIGVSEGTTVSNSFWNKETSGLTKSAGGNGLTTSVMANCVTYDSWDMTKWDCKDGHYPKLKNVSSDNDYDFVALKPEADREGGVYKNPLTVTLSGESGAAIYYTTDGSVPTTGSTTYNEPIQIESTTILKAILVDTAGNESQVLEVEYLIDIDSPDIVLSAEPENSTNQTVTIAVDISGENITEVKWEAGKQDIGYFQEAGTVLTEPFTFVVEENGTYTVYAKNNYGKEAVETITITNIDRDAPVVTGIEDGDVTNRDVTLTFDGTGGLNGQPFINGDTVTAEGAYTFTATDEAGNRTTLSFMIDKTAPTAPVFNVENPYYNNEPFSISLENGEDELSGVAFSEYRIEDGNWTTYHSASKIEVDETVVGEDAKVSIDSRTVDKAGNVSSIQTITVGLYLSPPVVDLTRSPSTPTNKEVTLTLKMEENREVVERKWARGEKGLEYFKESGNSFEEEENQIALSENGWITVYVKDAAGNESIEKVEVTNIDREKPIITIEGKDEIEIYRGTTFEDPGVTARDNLDGDLTEAIKTGGDTVNTRKTGEYTIIYYVTDRAGNRTEKSRKVTVKSRPSSGGGSGGGGKPSPDPDPAPEPPPADQTKKTVELDTNGGTVTFEGAELVIPDGALPNGGTITVEVEEERKDEWETQGHIIGDIFNFTKEPEGSFEKNVTISLPFDREKFDPNAQQLSLFWFDEKTNKWVELDNVMVDEANETVNGETDHFTTFAILATNLHREPYIKGYEDNTFRPGEPVTRAQMAVMIARNLGYEEEEYTEESPFRDVAHDYFAAGEIAFVKEKGIFKGDQHEEFRPGDRMTRAHMASVVGNYKKFDIKKEIETSFTDTQGHWAEWIIEANRDAGIIKGYNDGTFRPNELLTRAQAVKMMNRMFERGPLHGVNEPSFKDVPSDHWAFSEIESAARTYDYTLTEEGKEQLVN